MIVRQIARCLLSCDRILTAVTAPPHISGLQRGTQCTFSSSSVCSSAVWQGSPIFCDRVRARPGFAEVSSRNGILSVRQSCRGQAVLQRQSGSRTFMSLPLSFPRFDDTRQRPDCLLSAQGPIMSSVRGKKNKGRVNMPFQYRPLKMLREHSYHARMSTPGGRMVLMRQILKWGFRGSAGTPGKTY